MAEADLPLVSFPRRYSQLESWSHCFQWDELTIKNKWTQGVQSVDCSGCHVVDLDTPPKILNRANPSIPLAWVSAASC